MNYVTIFEATSEPFRHWWFVAPGLAFITVGALLVFWPALLERLGYRSKIWRVFSWFFFLFAVAWTLGAGTGVFGDALSASRDLEQNNCTTVEGRVENFHPMPKEGHDTERFNVNGTRFSYSDYIITSGFNNTASHGGPIREGLQVRICHQWGNILRLEIAE